MLEKESVGDNAKGLLGGKDKDDQGG